MEQYKEELLIFGFIVSIVGILGNSFLVVSILALARKKTFEIFLLGLSFSNLEEILIGNVFDIIGDSNVDLSASSCNSVRFLILSGHNSSIFFTMLISIFRYQKLRDAATRGNFPIIMDNPFTAWVLSMVTVFFAFILAIPTYFMNLDGHMKNLSFNDSCPSDIFLCPTGNCPSSNAAFKSFSLLIAPLLPLLVITLTSSLIIRILLLQRMSIAHQSAGQDQAPQLRNKNSGFQRSTTAVLTAMGIFQVDWTLYLLLYLYYDPYSYPYWTEFEFYATTSYTTISPYVYGFGNNLFSLKRIFK